MRLRGLFLWDMRFQAKYGFYFLYTVLTVIYSIVLFAIPDTWREKTAAILIFSDPASMGLFFMGAIVLLEKSQRTPCAFAVSPVRPMEYLIAKVGSLSGISLVVAAILSLAAKVDRLQIVLLGTVLSSVVFTLLAIMIAARISSLNQYILWTLPIELVCLVPAILHLLKITPALFRYYPFNICMEMVSGHAPSIMQFFIVIAWIALLFALSKCCVLKMWSRMGGMKL